MKDSTKQFIDALSRLDWFAQAGNASTLLKQFEYIDLKSAVISYRSDEWSNFTLMLKNRNFGILRTLQWDRSLAWNATVKEVRGMLESHTSLIQDSLIRVGFLGSDSSGIEWDLLNIAMEVEFADVIVPSTFTTLIWPIYTMGRIPCGWIGPTIDTAWSSKISVPLPQGKIAVF